MKPTDEECAEIRGRLAAKAADRQRLKRQRRAQAGMVKCEAWLTPENAKRLERLKSDFDMTTDKAINYALMISGST